MLTNAGTDRGAEHDKEIGSVAAAERAAKEGDASKTLSHLKDAGRWVLDKARKTGSESPAKVIAAAMELPPKR